MMNLSSDLSNPYLEYKLYEYVTKEIYPFYPCIKYKLPADSQLDGTDYFIVAESMHLKSLKLVDDSLDCSLSFTCEKGQKAFYKLIKDCLRFRIHEESFYDFRKQSWFSLIPGNHYE